jgi:hypothetical protein
LNNVVKYNTSYDGLLYFNSIFHHQCLKSVRLQVDYLLLFATPWHSPRALIVKYTPRPTQWTLILGILLSLQEEMYRNILSYDFPHQLCRIPQVSMSPKKPCYFANSTIQYINIVRLDKTYIQVMNYDIAIIIFVYIHKQKFKSIHSEMCSLMFSFLDCLWA